MGWGHGAVRPVPIPAAASAFPLRLLALRLWGCPGHPHEDCTHALSLHPGGPHSSASAARLSHCEHQYPKALPCALPPHSYPRWERVPQPICSVATLCHLNPFFGVPPHTVASAPRPRSLTPLDVVFCCFVGVNGILLTPLRLSPPAIPDTFAAFFVPSLYFAPQMVDPHRLCFLTLSLGVRRSRWFGFTESRKKTRGVGNAPSPGVPDLLSGTLPALFAPSSSFALGDMEMYEFGPLTSGLPCPPF